MHDLLMSLMWIMVFLLALAGAVFVLIVTANLVSWLQPIELLDELAHWARHAIAPESIPWRYALKSKQRTCARCGRIEFRGQLRYGEDAQWYRWPWRAYHK